jgi:8-oxo-dGTP pyrophosphatase MutT (NUDIX family)
LGYILAQFKEETQKEHPVQFGGRKLNSAEQNYTITELECLGVVWGVRKNKQFLRQNKFTLITDHRALETLRKQALPSIGRRVRWILELEQYNYKIKHRPGKKMAHVDFFSRNINNVEGKKQVSFEGIEIIPETEYSWKPIITVNETPQKAKWVSEDPILCNSPWWEVPIMVSEEERMDHSSQPIGPPKYVLIIVHDGEGIYMSQRLHSEKPMYLKYQVPCGKTEPGETGIQAACRELYEETALSAPHRKIKFLINDPDFDCDLYYVKMTEEIPERTEPLNMGPWMWYPWESFYKMAEENRLTPSLVKYKDQILKIVSNQ